MKKQKNGEIEFDNQLNEINRSIIEYILTPNQVRVYMCLSGNGTKTAIEIADELRIPKKETYEIINELQQRNIVSSMFGRPTKFIAMEIDEAVTILIDNEINKNKDN